MAAGLAPETSAVGQPPEFALINGFLSGIVLALLRPVTIWGAWRKTQGDV
jgi:hypothetical protein